MEKIARAAGKRPAVQPFPDYPGNARSFVHLDARLLPYWHTLFDVCPALLKLDPPDGTRIFRAFMTWAYRRQVILDWTFHLQVCRWLLESDYRFRIDEEHIETLMIAAAARWVVSDHSEALGVVASVGELEVAIDANAQSSGRFVNEEEFRQQWMHPGRVWVVARKKDVVGKLFSEPGFRYHLRAETRSYCLFSNEP